ncbi:VpsF family polysaccharide biosynthesis protein [Vibrio coralliilyticus]|uniref:VpsF family polysaccharide biosynthesis protein n=1 Tax=Vibrio coralliilyticus TaxID=190893 RepID=UPI0002F54258|nr:VpsF family polysaccharide biosynthesis protein [Vibrio coralliilyticus]
MLSKIYLLPFIAIASSILLGGYMLEDLGVPYVSQGGSPLFKIHLYSYLILMGFGLIFLFDGMKGIAQRLGSYYRFWLIALACNVFVILYGFAIHGSSGMAYLVNTFLAPVLIVPLLAHLNDNQKSFLLKLIAYLILLNSLVAVMEYMLHFRLVKVDFQEFSFFRSTAFLTHPLNNALITVSIALLVANKTKLPGFVYMLIVALALFAFGGRAALAIFICAVSVSFAPMLWKAITQGIPDNKQKIALFMLIGYFAFWAGAYLLVESGITERIASKLYIDGSASARLDVFYLIDQLSVREWIFGASHRLLESIELYLDIDVIENYLVGWIFTFGLVGAVPLFVTVFVPLGYFAVSGNYIERVTILSFALVSITNNSLTTKTPALLLLFTCLYLATSLRERLLARQNSHLNSGCSHA